MDIVDQFINKHRKRKFYNKNEQGRNGQFRRGNKPYRKQTPLDLKEKRTEEISNKYNLNLELVAYIRAAFLRGRYTKETLIKHIEVENEGRRKAIEIYKSNPELNDSDRKYYIESTQKNMRLRELAVETLNQLKSEELRDILR